MDQNTIEQIAAHYQAILRLLGENPEREGLLKTPMRAAKAIAFATSGYDLNPSDIIREAIFQHDGSRMIIVKDIEFYSLCEHHILPFFGKVSVGYLPSDKIVGLSKIARVVNAYARRLQVQERMTFQICQEIYRTLAPRGAIVVATADHLCMKMRGVEKQDAATTTVEYLGEFAENQSLRNEFFESLKHI
ncbi:MAG: GTP cyclohydrolase I FolE [Muribaculaceae bacterium]|nr:GTP cyclohydrolase I FolE [Muribaculaceae bacterium]